MKTKSYFICPLVDFTFKRLFGTENNKNLLIEFLNTTISADTGVIKDIQYMSQELVGQNESEKNVIFDIFCTNQNGDKFIIEMQRSMQHYFANRTISYVSRAISNSLRKGDKSYNIPTVYSINLLDFQPDMFADKNKYFWKVMLKDEENGVFSKKIVLYFFKLSNFAAQSLERRKCFEKQMDKWLYYLKNIQNMEEKDLQNEQDPVFRQLLEQCTYSKLNEMEQEKYNRDLLDYEGIKDAVEYAREEGREEGIAAGIEVGRVEEKKKTALKLLSLGIDIPTAVAITGLSEIEIIRMRDEG